MQICNNPSSVVIILNSMRIWGRNNESGMMFKQKNRLNIAYFKADLVPLLRVFEREAYIKG